MAARGLVRAGVVLAYLAALGLAAGGSSPHETDMDSPIAPLENSVWPQPMTVAEKRASDNARPWDDWITPLENSVWSRPMTVAEKQAFGYASRWDGWITYNAEDLRPLGDGQGGRLRFYADGWHDLDLVLVEERSTLSTGGSTTTLTTFTYEAPGWTIASWGNIVGSGDGGATYRLRAFVEPGHQTPPGTVTVVRMGPVEPDMETHVLGPMNVFMRDLGPEACAEYKRARWGSNVPHSKWDDCRPDRTPPHIVLVRPEGEWHEIIVAEHGLEACRTVVARDVTPFFPAITSNICEP